MKMLTKMMTSAALVAGLLTFAPTPSADAVPGGCVTLREARNTLTNGHQSRASITRGFGSRGERIDGHRTAMWVSYLPCVAPNRGHMDVVYMKRGGRWVTLYWAYYLRRGEGLNRVVAADSWDSRG